MKFKYNYQEIICWYNDQLINPQQEFTTNYGGKGFKLTENNPHHWITFTVYSNTIRVFYKFPLFSGNFIYYRKDIPKQEVIEWEFTEKDRIEKRMTGKWEFVNK